MASYFRSMFGGQAANTPPESRAHKRSPSAPSPSRATPNLNYIYAAPGTTPSTSSAAGRERSNSYVGARTNTPSPLRYTTNEPGSARSYSPNSHPSAQSQQKPARVQIYRSSSNIPGDRHATPYPIYTHSSSFSSVHSTSSSSINPASSSSHRPGHPPRAASSGSVAQSEPRPALKQAHTWHANTKNGPQPHVSFMNPGRTNSLHMHPLLACSRLHRPPISYDITYTPSSRTIIDRSTRSPIPAHTLAQPATDPPTLNRLVLKSSKIPWVVVASASGAKTSSRFYLAGSSTPKNVGAPVTNLDLLYAVHTTLSARVTQQEWEALGHGSRAQRKITRAYEKRCIRMGGGWDGGVRRIDYLGEKTRLVGVEVDKTADGGAGKLVFGNT